MKIETLNSSELRSAGYKALSEALGPLGMARFLRQMERGNGDYSRDRKKWLSGKTISVIAQRARSKKKSRR